MNVLLLAPYCGGSHRAWAEGYAAHSGHQVALVTLPARFWKWRMQGGAVTLAEKALGALAEPDLILATDMVNLPAFLGLARRSFAGVPVALYCHENQLTYPMSPGERRDLTYALINWLSMLAADRVFFNSRYHRQDWVDELPRLLKHFPDYTHDHRIGEVRGRSAVLPVGIDLVRLDRAGEADPCSRDGPPVTLWNQRWEYDKAPQTFFRALHVLTENRVPYRVALAGRCHRQRADEFGEARERLGARIVHYGHATPAEYGRLLHRAGVVVSTAIHEFFGVSVVEAVYCGCFPVLPRRLAYPEIVPPLVHDLCLHDDFDGLVARLRWALESPDAAREAAQAMRSATARFDWSVMGSCYDAALEAVVAATDPGLGR